MTERCDGCYYQGGCGREAACEHFDDYLLMFEEELLEEIIERNRAEYRDAFASYLRQWEN